VTGAAATKVDFYVLGAADARARLLTACRLAEKAWDQGLRVAVRTSSPAEAAELDDLLWTFSDRSFVPHGTWPAEPAFAAATAVLIGTGALPESHRDVLVNLASADSAKQALEAVGLILGKVTAEDSDQPEGKVLRQSPEPYQNVDVGSAFVPTSCNASTA